MSWQAVISELKHKQSWLEEADFNYFQVHKVQPSLQGQDKENDYVYKDYNLIYSL